MNTKFEKDTKDVEQMKNTDGKEKRHRKKHIAVKVISFVVLVCLIATLVCCNSNLLKGNKTEAKTTLSSEEVDNIVRNASNEISGEMSTYISNYFEENNITESLSDEDINQMAEIIANGIINNYSLTDEDIVNIKHEILNQLLQTFEVSGDTEVSYLTEEVKNYVTETVVRNIVESVQINNNTVTGNENTEAIADLVEKTDSTDESLVNTITDLSDAKDELSSTKDDLSATKDDLSSTKDDLSVTKDELNLTKEELSATASDLQEQSNALDERITTAQGNCDSLQERLIELTEELANMDSSNQTDLTKIAGEIVQLQADIQSASDELNSLQTEKEELATAIASNRTEIDSINQNVSDANSNISANANSILTNLSMIKGLDDSKVSVSDLNTYMLEMCYPVGSIYMSTQDVSPATFLGGTWERITDTTLVGAGNLYANGSTGGSTSATLSAGNIPSLSITGSTTAQNGVTTSANGAYNGTITSQGTYAGGNYGTSTNGNHRHNFGENVMGYRSGHVFNILPNVGDCNLWTADYYTSLGDTLDNGNHNHTVSIPNQTITSYGNLNIGNHSHALNIPSLYVNGSYTNNAVSAFSVQDPYTAVYMWKRVA